jgi:hypothetical protein
MALRRSIRVGQSIRGSTSNAGPRRNGLLLIGPGLPQRFSAMWGSTHRAFGGHSTVQDRGNRLAFAGLGALIAGGAGVYWALRPTAVEEVYITDRTASIARLFDSANDECATGHPYDARSRLWQWYFKAKRLVFLCTVFLPVAGMGLIYPFLILYVPVFLLINNTFMCTCLYRNGGDRTAHRQRVAKSTLPRSAVYCLVSAVCCLMSFCCLSAVSCLQSFV